MSIKDLVIDISEQEELLALLLDEAKTGLPQLDAISRVDRGGQLYSSFGQERLWFGDQLQPGTSTYNIPFVMRFSGPLDLAALERSLNEVVRRHEVLRTTFVPSAEHVALVIAPPPDTVLTVIDLSSLAATEREVEAQRLAAAETQQPFDLARGPQFRACLLRLSATDCILVITIHHILSDGWSMSILNRELSLLYKAYAAGESSPLKELTVQYADYAAWQRELLSRGELEEQLVYWKQQLLGANQELDLPVDHQGPPEQRFHGASEAFELSAATVAELRALSLRENTTLFMTLLAVFEVLLYRCSRQEDISVGTPVAGRMLLETEGLIGLFVNTLVLRTDMSGNPSFLELLGRIREVTLGALAHQDVPFEKLVEEMHPERNLSRTPLVQVMFILQNTLVERLNLTRLKGTEITIPTVTAKFDLTLEMVETANGVTGTLMYRTQLFEAATISRLVGYFQTLVKSIVADPGQRVAALPLLSAAEREQLLLGFNDTESAYPRELSLAQLFEAQAARTPAAVALVFGQEQVSYGELNRRANQLGHYLRQQGVGPEVLVGLCLERSVELVVGLLGILKAGGAYLPLDPAYPEERLAFMLADAGVRVLLTEQALLERLGESPARVVCLELDAAAIAAQPETQLPSQTSADNLAYVIYTSGSTGRPKGVQITHRSLINFLTSMRHQPGMSDHDSFLSITTLSFDIAALELYLPLLVGGRVVLVSREVATDGAALARYLMNIDVTLMQATPAMWRILVEAGWKGSDSLKILCGGEALTLDLAQELHQRSKELWNVYGPTETTVWSGALKVAMTDKTIRIGGPIANTQLYVLDKYLELTSTGVAGELYIGGEGLGRGYLNRSGLTAEKFIPNHFSTERGGRLYRTGDLVRYLADGSLEYLGRIDNQVKLRGFRIELGEVEATLAQHPAVVDQAVVVREDVPGNKLLVAYIVTKDEARLTSTELRSCLKERLPDYMVPSVFAMLASLPLTPNGKIDRKALPAPERIGMGSESTYLAPRTSTEEVLVEMWADLIGVQPVGVNDNFFELGGHSLLATQLIFRLRKKFRVEVPLYELFKEPTIAGLATTIEISLEKTKGLKPVGAFSESRKERRLLSYSQQRLWFLAQLEPETPAHNESIALRLNGRLDVSVLQQSIDEIIRRHEVLRATFASEDGQAVQMVLADLKLNLPLQDLTGMPAALREAEAQRIITEEVRRPFDLSHDPLLRSHLLRLNEAEHVLVLMTHHIVCDRSSLGLFARELTALYDAYQHGQPSSLPELLMQYADFARWQRDWVKAEALKTQLPYWKQQLAGAESVPELNPDKPRPAVRSFNGARHKLRISPHLLQALRALSDHQDATLFMTVLTALDVLLHYYTKSANIVLGTDVAGRNSVESASLIGPFVNQLALSTHVSGDPTFGELLAHVQETVVAAHAHQSLPFEEIVDALKPARDRGRTPLFQLKLVFQDPPMPEIELSELRIAPLEIQTGVASFDMTVSVEETSPGLSVIFEYNTDLYEPSRVGSISRCLEILLEKVAVESEARVSVLKDLLRETEQQQQGQKQAELKTSVGQKLRNLKRKTVQHSVKETIV